MLRKQLRKATGRKRIFLNDDQRRLLAVKAKATGAKALDDKPIFFPGTIDDYENQGGKWGYLPSLDDHFYFIHMAWYLAVIEGGVDVLYHKANGRTILERLELAFNVPPSDSKTQLVHCDEQSRGVTFGFVDSIVHTGDLLFCSLLKYRAANELTEIFNLVGNHVKAGEYAFIADSLKCSINEVFPPDPGLPRAATGVSSQGDVWAAAFGVYVDAFDFDASKVICDTLRDSYLDGTLAYRGNIRHVRTCDDFSESTAWERCVGDFVKNRYQNGAYWNTPTGWIAFAIGQVDMAVAVKLATEYIDQLREDDFRKGQEFGSPWECIHPEDNYKQNSVYMTSITCPLAAFRRLF